MGTRRRILCKIRLKNFGTKKMRCSQEKKNRICLLLPTMLLSTILARQRKKGNFSEVVESNFTYSNQYTGLQEVLENALNQLPADQKSVILLRDYEGYAYDEIAEITGLTESQVKVYIFRGRKFLQQFLGSIEQVL